MRPFSLLVLVTIASPVFAGPPAFNAPSVISGQGVLYLIATDFNNDGHSDIASTDAVHGNVRVSLNQGQGTFSNAVCSVVPFPQYLVPRISITTAK